MSRDHFWRECWANCQSDPIRSRQSDPGFVKGRFSCSDLKIGLTAYFVFSVFKGAMSRPAHVQDFCLLCWFSQLSAILDLGNQADFWQQISVYNTVLSEFLLVYLSIFFVEFYRSCRREIMILFSLVVLERKVITDFHRTRGCCFTVLVLTNWLFAAIL